MNPQRLLPCLLLSLALATAFPGAAHASSSSIVNTGFETGSSQPTGWTSDTVSGTATFLWDSAAAHSGGRSGKITLADAGIARWTQEDLILDLNSEYELSGWVKTDNVQGGPGARIAVYGTNPAELLLAASTSGVYATQNWTQVKVRFLSGTAPLARVACTVGEADSLFFRSAASGTMWCDDVKLTKLRALPRTQVVGQHVTLDVYSEEYAQFNNAKAYVTLLDGVYNDLRALVGRAPYGGGRITVVSGASMYSVALSGQRIAVAPGTGYSGGGAGTLASFVNAHGIDFALPHELGHDFDQDSQFFDYYIGPKTFNNAEHWANLKLLYAFNRAAARQPSLTMDIFGATVPLSQVGQQFVTKHAQPWIDQQRKDYQNMHNDVYTGLLYTLVKRVGWTPFKAVFREYERFRLAGVPVPTSDEKRVELFANVLSQKAGVDLVQDFQVWGFPIQKTTSGHMVISSIVFRSSPTATGSIDPEIVLLNPMNKTINITNWTVSDNGGQIVKFGSQSPLDPQESYDLAPNLRGGLRFAGDRLVLKEANGRVVDAISWGSDTTQLSPAIQNVRANTTLSRLVPYFDTNSANDWHTSADRAIAA